MTRRAAQKRWSVPLARQEQRVRSVPTVAWEKSESMRELTLQTLLVLMLLLQLAVQVLQPVRKRFRRRPE